jgi:hypothetical protein
MVQCNYRAVQKEFEKRENLTTHLENSIQQQNVELGPKIMNGGNPKKCMCG